MTAKTKAAAKSKGGRPTRYKAEYAEQAYKLCLLGATDEQIAWFFDVTVATLAQWAWDCQEFYDAITPTAADLKRNSEKWAAISRKRAEARRARIARNPSERIANAVRGRMWASIRKGRKLSRLPYSLDELTERLERLFVDGMSWDNYGKWHIDHIKPCAAFDLTDPKQFDECWALRNLQPLWASDNIRKGAKYVCS